MKVGGLLKINKGGDLIVKNEICLSAIARRGYILNKSRESFYQKKEKENY